MLTAVLLVWLWLRLWQWILLLIISAFLAVGLDPVVEWLDRHRIRRAYGASLVVLLIAGLLVGFAYLAGAELIEQARLLGGRVEAVQQEVMHRLPPFLLKLLPTGGQGGESQLADQAAGFGRAIAGGVLSLGIALILTIYFLLDGRRTYEWLVAFAPHHQRARVRQTAIESRQAVLAYVRGNAATSALAAVVAYVFLLIAGVPAPLLLALLTGLFDFIPVIGVFLTAIPMVLLALTVSTWVAIATAAFNAALQRGRDLLHHAEGLREPAAAVESGGDSRLRDRRRARRRDRRAGGAADCRDVSDHREDLAGGSARAGSRGRPPPDRAERGALTGDCAGEARGRSNGTCSRSDPLHVNRAQTRHWKRRQG